MGHTLRVSTAVVGHRRIWARRLGECRLADGRPRGDASRPTGSCSTRRNRIVRIPADFGVAFTNPEVDAEILRVAGAASAPPRPLPRRSTVRPSDLDPLDHVNNAVYLDWLEEALGAAGWPLRRRRSGSCRLEYLASAERGDDVAVELHGEPAAWQAVIRRADGLELVRAMGTERRRSPHRAASA